METTNKTTTNSNTKQDANKGGYKGRGGAGGGRGRLSFDRPKPEFDQKIISIRRVTRVVAGGRRFSFSVAIAIGDKKGSVGLGTGKANDTALAITKALKSAKKNMIKLGLTKTMSISHEAKAKFSSSRLMIMPNKGRGIVAGSSVRDVLNLAGVKDVTSKIYSGSKNKLNNAKAAIMALSEMRVNKKAEVINPIVEEIVMPTPEVVE